MFLVDHAESSPTPFNIIAFLLPVVVAKHSLARLYWPLQQQVSFHLSERPYYERAAQLLKGNGIVDWQADMQVRDCLQTEETKYSSTSLFSSFLFPYFFCFHPPV